MSVENRILLSDRKPLSPNYQPIYDPSYLSYLDFRDIAGDIKRRFERRPLDIRYIDWLANQGTRIIYVPWMESGKGYYLWTTGIIEIGNAQNDAPLEDLTLAHELIHGALPGSNIFGSLNKAHDILDEIAKEMILDDEFMNYAKTRLPSSCHARGTLGEIAKTYAYGPLAK